MKEVCKNNPEYDSCYNGTSSGTAPSIPDLNSLTCCKSSVLHGRLPTKEQFVSDTCCLPGGQTCLLDDTCCSKQCLGLRGPDTSGNCSGPTGNTDAQGNHNPDPNVSTTSICSKWTTPVPPSRPHEIHHHHHYHIPKLWWMPLRGKDNKLRSNLK